MERILMNTSSASDVPGLPSIPKDILLKAKEVCLALHATTSASDLTYGTFCPRVFDGWSCWNDTPSGQTAFVNCPKFVVGFDHSRFGHRICLDNGSWFHHPHTNIPWSNYTDCVDLSTLERHLTVNRIYIAGYSISLVSLIASIVIFCFFRSLKCKRITIHKNLFVSFIINNFLWLLWHLFVAESPAVVSDNGVGCQLLHIFLHYFLVSNYLWMFCEGLYLHTLLVIAFVSEEKILKWFYMLGWGSPVVLVSVYAFARSFDEAAKQYCWVDDSLYGYILTIPVMFSMAVNLFFLVNIVRVLLKKLRAASNNSPDNQSTRKAVRATLILIPLLGLHYIIIPFRPSPGSAGHHVYNIISAVASSFQGFAVSLLFCFFNGEVLAICRKKWNQHRLMTSPQSHVATSVLYMKSSMTDGPTLASCDEVDLQDF